MPGNLTAAVATLAAALTLPLCAFGQTDFVDPAGLRQAGLTRFWQLQLPLEPDQTLADVWLVDEALYVATTDGYVFSIHADTGLIRWLRRVSASGFRIRRPAHAGRYVAFVTPIEVLFLERVSGEPLARDELSFPAGTAAVSDGSNIYAGGIDGRFYALQLRLFTVPRASLTRTAAFNGRFDVASEATDQRERIGRIFEVWKAGAHGPILSTPALRGETLFVASTDGSVYAATAATKAFRWAVRLDGPVSADLVADDQGVYVACEDRSLYLLALGGGQVRWRARLNAALTEPPVLAPGLAFQYSPVDGLCAIDARPEPVEQRVRWELPGGRRLLSVDPHHAWVLADGDHGASVEGAEELWKVALDDGRVLARVAVPGFSLAAPRIAGTFVHLASPTGRLLCARPVDTPALRREELGRAFELPRQQTPGAPVTTAPAPEAARGADAARPVPAGPAEPRGPVVGGKSRVSREYSGGSGTRP